MSSYDSLPQHIRVYIEDELIRSSATDGVSTVQIKNVTTFRSAQQQIYLVQLGQRDNNESSLPDNHKTISSPSSTVPTTAKASSNTLEDCIRQGNNYIVIKIWTGTSRWWNCHHTETSNSSTANTRSTTSKQLPMMGEGIISTYCLNDCINDTTGNGTIDEKDVQTCQQQQQQYIAQQEIGGYQAAYHVFISTANALFETETSSSCAMSSVIRIPRVLYSSLSDYPTQGDNSTNRSNYRPPWCILEYVGPYSLYFNDPQWIQHDTSYIDAMISIRKEFGFDEPHLRWGRLPIHLCVPYSLQLLNSFIVPLHMHYFINVHGKLGSTIRLPTSQMKIYFFDSVLELIKSKIMCCIVPNVATMSDHDVEPIHAKVLRDASQILKAAIHAIYDEVVSSSIQNLPPVLCHMDLQPQNIIFGTSPCSITSNKGSHTDKCAHPILLSQKPCNCQLISVLDWEEAAYADPRFEMLLLCRKVCATREQADFIWQCYTDMINQRLAHHEGSQPIQLGPITPWLKLEAIQIGRAHV